MHARPCTRLTAARVSTCALVETLTASREAVELHRSLPSNLQPAVFHPVQVLAASLSTNLSNRLSDLGDLNGALQFIREAVTLHSQLASDYPAVYNPVPASCLVDLSGQLSDTKCRAEAINAPEEAVTLGRSLAAEFPSAFLEPSRPCDLAEYSVATPCRRRSPSLRFFKVRFRKRSTCSGRWRLTSELFTAQLLRSLFTTSPFVYLAWAMAKVPWKLPKM